jgi:hypothetical protein
VGSAFARRSLQGVRPRLAAAPSPRFLEGRFEEPEWCTKGHAIHVLEGSFTLRLRDREVRMKAGDVGFLASGQDAHKAVLGPKERVRLLLFEVL